MPYVKNESASAVRQGPYRLGAGQTGYVDDDAFDKIKDYEGVSKVSDKEGKEAGTRTTATPGTGRDVAEERVTQSRKDARQASVTAPLQRVVGDDQAPLGPPTGTITTKQLAAKEGLLERLAFADHEAVEKVDDSDVEPGFSGRDPGAVVHNKQAEAAEAADEFAQELIEAQKEANEGDEQPSKPAESGKPASSQ